MKLHTTLALGLGALGLCASALASPYVYPSMLPQPAHGNLWITQPNSTFDCGAGAGTNSCFRDATFQNIPGVPADVTFSTSQIGFSSFGNPINAGNPFQNATVGSFLNSLQPTPATYSGAMNAYFGAPVDANTPILHCANNTCQWLTFIEITGSIFLNTGDDILIAHDDGVSLKLNGVLQTGFTLWNAPGVVESVTYMGAPGLVNFDLVYAASHSDPEYLEMQATPEPLSLALFGSGLAALFAWRRKRAR